MIRKQGGNTNRIAELICFLYSMHVRKLQSDIVLSVQATVGSEHSEIVAL